MQASNSGHRPCSGRPSAVHKRSTPQAVAADPWFRLCWPSATWAATARVRLAAMVMRPGSARLVPRITTDDSQPMVRLRVIHHRPFQKLPEKSSQCHQQTGTAILTTLNENPGVVQHDTLTSACRQNGSDCVWLFGHKAAMLAMFFAGCEIGAGFC